MNTIKKCFFIIFTLSLISCTFQEEDKQSKADITWVNFDSYLSDNIEQPVFINVTADWCANCQYLEERVLETQEFKEYLDNNNVLPVRADVTKPADFTKVKAWFKENVKENFLGAQTYVVLDNSGAKVFKSGRPLLKHIRN